MIRFYFKIFCCLLLFLLIDRQVSLFASVLLPEGLSFTSYLIFLAILYLFSSLETKTAVILVIFLGSIYDFYYLSLLGVAIFYWPWLFTLLNYYFDFNRLHRIWMLVMQLLLIFIFENVLYFISSIIEEGGKSYTLFVVNSLSVTLLGNIILGLLLYPIIKYIFQNNRHSIVTNV